MVKREVLEWIKAGRKTIELRRGKAKAGNEAVFLCGRNILRGKIISKDEGDLSTLLRNLNFRELIPTANSVQEATTYIKKLYGSTEGMFTAYQFTLKRLKYENKRIEKRTE